VMSCRESMSVPSRSKTTAAGRTIPSDLDEFGLDPALQHSRLVAAVEQELHRTAAGRAVISRPLVDVHADETVRALRIVLQAPGVARSVAERLLPVAETVLDALRQQPAEPPLELRLEVPPDAVAAERQRPARLLLPPGAEIHHRVQPELSVGELPFVDHHPGVHLAADDRVHDVVEGDD